MFLEKEKIKSMVNNIIYDNVDNDVIFIVASKGIGKTAVLHEIYDKFQFDHRLIVVDGRRIVGNASSIKKCFVDGIIAFVERCDNITDRVSHCMSLRSYLGIATAFGTLFKNRGKIRVKKLGKLLCSFPIEKLKEIYVSLAGDTPLVIISNALILSPEEIDYLITLHSDTFGEIGSRVTFIISARANTDNINCIKSLNERLSGRVWIMPLLPQVLKKSDEINPKSISSISIDQSGEIQSFSDCIKANIVNQSLLEMYEAVNELSSKVDPAIKICLFANQEINESDYILLTEFTHKLYHRIPLINEQHLVLPYNGKLLWIDALSYFLALQLGIEDAIHETQQFFLSIINAICSDRISICYGNFNRKAFTAFIADISKKKGNVFAEGFSKYYADFAILTKILYQDAIFQNQHYSEMLSAVDVLDRVLIEFSDSNLDAMMSLYDSTQICYVLDIGFEMINHFLTISPSKSLNSIPEKTFSAIVNFLALSLREAYKWGDITLLSEIISLEKKLNESIGFIRFPFTGLTTDSKNSFMFELFLQLLKVEKLKIGDIIMPKSTIFLSYSQENKEIADCIEEKLGDLGYDVCRDVHAVETWDSLKSYMRSIRNKDYAVFLVSDAFLKSDNCLFEIMQFLKEREYNRRAFPISISFSREAKIRREKDGKPTSMFSLEYMIEVVQYWQERAKQLEALILQLTPENIGELALEYRDKKNMAQTASEFIRSFLLEDLLGRIDLEKTPEEIRKSVETLAVEIDRRIQGLKENDSNHLQIKHPPIPMA